MLKVVIDESDFDKWLNRILSKSPAVLSRLLDEAGRAAKDLIQEKAPVRTGALRESVVVRREGPHTVVVGPTVPYAPYVEFGVGPHEILPVKARALRFSINGETIFATHVWHPGFPGRFFMREAYQELPPILRSIALNLYHKLYGAV